MSNDGDSPVIKRDLLELERHLKQFILEWKTSSARWMIRSFLGAADRLFRDYFNRDLFYDAPLEMTAIERIREFAQANFRDSPSRPGEDQEHWIPLFAITSVSTGENGQ